MIRSLLTTGLVTVALVAAVGAQRVIHLASLQVVDLDGRLMLRLAADGPIASAPEPDPAGQPVGGDRLRLRLYGVQATADLFATSAAPFVVTATAAGPDTILEVSAPGLSGSTLAVGQTGYASQLSIVVR